jgi:hypothetical protein
MNEVEGLSPRPRRHRPGLVSSAVIVALALGTPAAAQDAPPAPTTSAPQTTSTTAAQTTSTSSPESPTTSTSIPDDDATTTTTSPGTTRRSTGSLIPPPLDLSAIDQLAGVRRAEAMAKAQELADAFNAKAMESAAGVAATRDSARMELELAEAALADTQLGLDGAEARVGEARARMSALAIESYQLAMTDDPGVFLESTDVLRGIEGYEDYVRTTSYSQAAAAALRTQRSAAEEEVVAASRKVEEATAHRDHRRADLDVAEEEMRTAVATVEMVAADGRRRVEDAKATGTALTAGSRGPAILGGSVVPAKYMAEFVRLRGRPHPSVDVEALAEHYVAEGEAEGVTGDIAWVQSVLETGWFNFGGSMVRVGDHNYAGIGACDSCSSGHGYPTPELGVRAQIQLLRTYAQPGLTSDQLASPPAGRAPEGSRVRGCCSTWMELTGVWATANNYGVRILEIYNELLVFAAARQRQDLALLAAAQAAAPAVPTDPAPLVPGATPVHLQRDPSPLASNVGRNS